MGPSRVPYNLRSRGRVVSNYMLRRQEAPMDKAYRKSSRRCRSKPSIKPIREEERESMTEIKPNHEKEPMSEIRTISDEESQDLVIRTLKVYLDCTHPYPLMAIDQYNKKLKEEDHVLFSGFGTQRIYKYLSENLSDVSFIMVENFMALPKSIEKRKSSGITYFVARFHRMTKEKCHVDAYMVGSSPPNRGESIKKYLPLCCERCKIMNKVDVHSQLSLKGEVQTTFFDENVDCEYEIKPSRWA